MSELEDRVINLVLAAEDVLRIDEDPRGSNRLPGCTDEDPCDCCQECTAYMWLADAAKQVKAMLPQSDPRIADQPA